MQPLTIVLAAGGTGGHLFPAEALSHAVQKRGHRVELITDRRAIEFAGGFPAEAVHAVPSGTPTRPGLLAKAEALIELGKGVLAARRLLKEIAPDIVVGFGGYPTVPPILAAALNKIPTLIHEQNAVVGRANRFLSGWVDVIATGFATVGGLSEAARAKCVHVGNPVRPAVAHAASKPFTVPVAGGDLNVLVFGGSQGARVMADVTPPALEKLPPEALRRLVIVQQARVEDDRRVRQTYERLGVRHEIQPFFKDLPERMAAAQLIISRSGASTIAELGVIGRPSILVPLPGALDQDQAANAR
jgi:UDP-N-acetylglucosamine--N-acetylmuramyl-(pentapeptide) pyrophosphoryl-undecaprenol N-acetylglucosamine transferase